MNQLRQAFLHALAAHNTTQSAFADRAKVTPTAIHKFLRGSAPRNDLFRAIVQAWPDRETKRHLLRAHIADEIERAGLILADYEPALDMLDDRP